MARSKEFDEQVVLRKAMDVFWAQGYEKTSMQDLVDQMGIHRRSIYDTFGDKHSLFVAALAEYERFITKEMERIIDRSPSVKQAIRDVFLFILESATDNPKGCLSVNTAVELSLLDTKIDEIVTDMFRKTEAMLQQLIEQGQSTGEVSSAIHAKQTARFLHNNLVGLRVLVKTDYDQEELESVINLAVRVLD
ncbi:TetR family transcriptional regulator [Exiguobacterium sp. BMC-KP]|uniref:TetR/AcrR family transcriptional regulator n=1 Tax=Exiguobacterium sp. BMC-KP TaxID=1684312 RepID=UPI0006AA4220|nr:TetR/AcrR family transcriptional regulator [Exiguobacterium sp. BMC-KP]KOP29057.1 TetR family transcriptional regulator [Exiguobacterium sp. BMC-KP]